MVPAVYHDFFMASVGASAALVGLLFVAVSVFPDRIVGPKADSERQAEAANAFSALLNAFFISLGALIPGLVISALVLVMGAFSLLNTSSLIVAIWRSYRAKAGGLWSHERISSIGLILGSLYIYGAEVWWGIETINGQSDVTVAFVTLLLLFSYGLALVRAWALLGARRNSIGDLVGSLLQTVGVASHANHENYSDRTPNMMTPDAPSPDAPSPAMNTATAPASAAAPAEPIAKTPQPGEAS